MAIEDLKLPIPSRQKLIEKHLQYRDAWNPGIDTSEGGEPYLDAIVAADTHIPLVAHSRRITQAAFPSTAISDDVAFWGDIHGVDPSPATGALGLVRITASVGGAEILEGTALTVKGRTNGPRFLVQVTSRYFDGSAVPIVSLDTGPETNLEPGTVLQWAQSPPGVGPTAVVIDQDGEGLVGGRAAATPEEHKAAILDKLRDPSGAENDAHYRAEARKAGVPVLQAFSYPALFGPGTTGLAFLVFPTKRGGSRSPTSQQIQRVGDHLDNAFGADDSILMCLLNEEPATVAFKIDWARGASGWSNPAPWPEYGAAGSAAIIVGAVTDALTFTLRTANNSYSGITAPTAGKQLAFYDTSKAQFVQKRIGTVTGSGPWQITVDTTNSASDEEYAPKLGQRVSPWSESLSLIADGVVEAFSKLGPGEMLPAVRLDERRRYRNPQPPAQWPYRLTQDLLEGSVSPSKIGAVFDRSLVEGDGREPLVGLPGSYVNILTLGDLGVFPKS